MMKKLAVVMFLLVACSIQVQGRDIAKWPHPFFSNPTCLSDLSAAGACVHDLFSPNPKPECCSAFQKVGDDCANSVFSAPFFKMLVKQHCSSN
ncbi:hypothetical protein Dsin_026525 [Dipteronia sinensis]|uniref:Prolamin-like domain-containing protein n=1 Tax=Dipteronia sinensis TaxID=43782 RepID=A0AAD9ZXT4_9ROSI|nr:hypothetical protein Dsin_026525 [Dipteronia sinensis]